MKRGIKILSTGKYLPKKVVPAAEIDRVLGLRPGSSAQMSGVEERRYVTDEVSSQMGAYALMDALEKSGIRYNDLDAIISASGTSEQELPCTAALIQRQLNQPRHPIPCFDINATCLSFVTAYDMASSLIETKRFKNIAIVSTEVASCGLNAKQHEAYSLFGDGAAAVIVTAPSAGETSGVVYAKMNTFSEGADHCKIEGGGSKHHPSKQSSKDNPDLFLFSMEGRKVFKLVLETIPPFFDTTLKESGLTLDTLDLVIPHQASASGMELVRRKLGIDPSKYVDILAKHGNMIAASIPLALHYAIEQGRLKRGQKVMLLGTSAGMSIGTVIFEY